MRKLGFLIVLPLSLSGCSQTVAPRQNVGVENCGWYDAMGIEFCLIPGGTFQMGDERFPTAKPPFQAWVKEFFLMKSEMTEENWRRFAAVRSASSSSRALPMVDVSRDDVYAAIMRRTNLTPFKYRLPSEPEWEYAARAGTKTAFHWGEGYDKNHANFVIGGDGVRSRVGSFRSNQFGLHDMIGNVAEMTSGYYSRYPLGQSKEFTGWYSYRGDGIGGGWSHVFGRGMAEVHEKHPWLGFRLAFDADAKGLLSKRRPSYLKGTAK